MWDNVDMETKVQSIDSEYRKAYNRGWRSSLYSEGSGVLDGADGRGEPDAWYDGYYDAGAGREKWHLARCTAHHNGPGGCGAT